MRKLRRNPLPARGIRQIHRRTPVAEEGNRCTEIHRASEDIREHTADTLGRNLCKICRGDHDRHSDPQACDEPASQDLGDIAVADDDDDEPDQPEQAEELQRSNTSESVTGQEGEEGSDDTAELDHAGDVGEDVRLVAFGSFFELELVLETLQAGHAANEAFIETTAKTKEA